LATVVFSGGAAVLGLYLWHHLRRHPAPTRNVIGGVCEASTAGNAIATPLAVATMDPTLMNVQAAATAQVAADAFYEGEAIASSADFNLTRST
jgi:2-keto-3-deoxygluconate permease